MFVDPTKHCSLEDLGIPRPEITVNFQTFEKNRQNFLTMRDGCQL
jgi:hypothetical protein